MLSWFVFLMVGSFSVMEHPNIVLLKGVCLNPPCICTEFMDCGKQIPFSRHVRYLSYITPGDLHSFLDDGRNAIAWNQCILIARDIAAGMQFLHSQFPPKIHRDLKSPNILVCMCYYYSLYRLVPH